MNVELGEANVANALRGSNGGRCGEGAGAVLIGGLPSLSGLGSGGADDNDAQAYRLIASTLVSPGKQWNSEQNLPNLVAFNPQAGGSKARIGGESDIPSALQASQVTGIAHGAVVRRLTPLECERLQGLPDDWTAQESDSARYAMLGNAVAVPVAEWVGRRILAHEAGMLRQGDTVAF